MNHPKKLGTTLSTLMQQSTQPNTKLFGPLTLQVGTDSTLKMSSSHTVNTGSAQKDGRSNAPLTVGTAHGAHGSGQNLNALALVEAHAKLAPAQMVGLLVRTEAALPDGVKQSISAEVGMLYPKDGTPRQGLVRTEKVKTPAPEDLPALDAALTIYREAMAPADDAHVAIEIERLMLHFPVKDMTPAMNTSVAMDWLDDLGAFPLWAIKIACKEWRQTQKWRPTIAEFRTLCDTATWLHRYKMNRMFQMMEAARKKAAADEKVMAEVKRMKEDGSWEVARARLFGAVRVA